MAEGRNLPVPVNRVEQSILTVRGRQVIVDADLAAFYGVTTKQLNQAAFSRHPDKFPKDFAFELTAEEKKEVITNCDHLSNLKFSPHPVKVYTEHGVLQAASVLNSERANAVSVALVRAFIRLRQLATVGQLREAVGMDERLQVQAPPRAARNRPTGIQKRIDAFLSDVSGKLEHAVNQVLDSVVNPRKKTTVREEAEELIDESIGYLKSKLKKAGLENEEIGARIAKMLAEAENFAGLARINRELVGRVEAVDVDGDIHRVAKRADRAVDPVFLEVAIAGGDRFDIRPLHEVVFLRIHGAYADRDDRGSEIDDPAHYARMRERRAFIAVAQVAVGVDLQDGEILVPGHDGTDKRRADAVIAA